MACGCGNQSVELWETVYKDRTVSQPMTKAQATAEAQQKGGYIREASALTTAAK